LLPTKPPIKEAFERGGARCYWAAAGSSGALARYKETSSGSKHLLTVSIVCIGRLSLVVEAQTVLRVPKLLASFLMKSKAFSEDMPISMWRDVSLVRSMTSSFLGCGFATGIFVPLSFGCIDTAAIEINDKISIIAALVFLIVWVCIGVTSV